MGVELNALEYLKFISVLLYIRLLYKRNIEIVNGITNINIETHHCLRFC